MRQALVIQQISRIPETSTSNSSKFLGFPRQALDEIANSGKGARQMKKSKGKGRKGNKEEEKEKTREEKNKTRKGKRR